MFKPLCGKALAASLAAGVRLVLMLLGLGLLVLLSPSSAARAQGPIVMGVDPEISGNSPDTLGTLESCVRVDVPSPSFNDVCDDAADDDSDGYVNDGCKPVGYSYLAAEMGVHCANSVDDDGDGHVNDGCPAVGEPEPRVAVDHYIDVYVTGDVDPPIAYDAYVTYYDAGVTYDATKVHVTYSDPLIKMPGAIDFSEGVPDSDGSYIAAAIYLFWGVSGIPGDGTLVRLGLDIGGSGLVAFDWRPHPGATGYASCQNPPACTEYVLHPVTRATAILAINEDCPGAPAPDADGDTIPDAEDACPDTPSSERPVDANGCSQRQVDQDLDGLCDPGKASSLCAGSDACPDDPEDLDGFQDHDGCAELDVSVTRAEPVQVLQGVPLVQNKDTMVRAFLKLSPVSDLQDIVLVSAQLELGSHRSEVEGWLVNFGGKTFVLPTYQEAIQLVQLARRGQLSAIDWRIQYWGIDALNFEEAVRLPGPGFVAVTVMPKLWVQVNKLGQEVGRRSTFVDSDESNNRGRKDFTVRVPGEKRSILIARAKPLGASFRTSDDDFWKLAHEQFSALLATYPLVESSASPTGISFDVSLDTVKIPMAFVKTPIHIPDKVRDAVEAIQGRARGAAAVAILNPICDGWKYWKCVFVVPRSWLVVDGKSNWGQDHAVVIAEDAEMFTAAHEIGHTYRWGDEGEPCSVAGDGWDVNHATLAVSNARISAGGEYNFYSFMCRRGPWWITEKQYRQLLNDLTVP